jgi:hypothetical protein
MTLDPVELIRSSSQRRAAMFRCRRCGCLQSHDDALPTGGAPCAGCTATITPLDGIEYASARARFGALVVDVCCLTLPIIAVAVASLPFNGLIATDDKGRTTRNAVIVTSTITAAVFFLYVAMTTSLRWSGLSNHRRHRRRDRGASRAP